MRPQLYQQLFENDGRGPLLRKDIIPIGSQTQVGMLRLALGTEVQGEANTLAATAGQVSALETRIKALEVSVAKLLAP